MFLLGISFCIVALYGPKFTTNVSSGVYVWPVEPDGKQVVAKPYPLYTQRLYERECTAV